MSAHTNRIVELACELSERIAPRDLYNAVTAGEQPDHTPASVLIHTVAAAVDEPDNVVADTLINSGDNTAVRNIAADTDPNNVWIDALYDHVVCDGAVTQPDDGTLVELIARNPLIGADRWRTLLEHRSLDVRCVALTNPCAPPDELAVWAQHEHNKYRVAVARNASASEDLLAELTGDDDDNVVSAVARNAGLTEPVMWMLAEHSANVVRRTLCYHPAVTDSVLHELAGDSDQFVADTARVTRTARTEQVSNN